MGTRHKKGMSVDIERALTERRLSQISEANDDYTNLRPTGVSDDAPQPPPSLRWVVLVCAALIPVGAHTCYKMTSSIEHPLNKRLDIDKSEYGMLNSAVSGASLALIPFAAGYFVDARPSRMGAALFALASLVGQLLFTLAVWNKSYNLALVARAIFGVGESTVLVAQGAICAQWFGGATKKELAFAIGITEMTHNMGNWLGKVSINVGQHFGDEVQATCWFGVGMCVFSMIVAVVFYKVEQRAEHRYGGVIFSKKHIDTGECGLQQCWTELKEIKLLSGLFWLLVLLHLLASNIEHLFDAVSADFVKDKWDTSVDKAAWLSSLNYALAIVLSPVVGYFMDAANARMLVAGCACLIVAAAHTVLGVTHVTPILGLLMLAVGECVLPTVLRASVPLVLPAHVIGVAYGVYEVAENVGKAIGNPVVGYLKDHNGNYTIDELIFAAMGMAAAGLCVVISVYDSRGSNLLTKSKSEETASEAGQFQEQLKCDP